MEQKLIPQWTETKPSDYLLYHRFHSQQIEKERPISLEWNIGKNEITIKSNFGNEIKGKLI